MTKNVIIIFVTLSFFAGCSGSTPSASNYTKDGGGADSALFDSSDPFKNDFSGPYPDGMVMDQPTINYDAFFANDPPPQYCGPDGGWTAPDLPGGTIECPDDKNREGCPCKNVGEVAPCWPGLRVNRNRGICHDGQTTCTQHGELSAYWGPCEGYVLPVPGVTKGPEACHCFSSGQWVLSNLSPCFVTYSGGETWGVSTFESGGNISCPTNLGTSPPPQPQPGYPWSQNTLNVDCAGQFKLCYTIKSGDMNNPLSSDCVVAQVCTEAWYGQKNVTQTLPPLPSWTATSSSCSKTFVDKGGYGEMTVIGESVECEIIDDNGAPYVFNRVQYCPLYCNDQPNLPECVNCRPDGSGTF